MESCNDVALPLDNRIERFQDYIVNTWMNDGLATFPREMWNHYHHITNNFVMCGLLSLYIYIYLSIIRRFSVCLSFCLWFDFLENRAAYEDLNLAGIIRNGQQCAVPNLKLFGQKIF